MTASNLLLAASAKSRRNSGRFSLAPDATSEYVATRVHPRRSTCCRISSNWTSRSWVSVLTLAYAATFIERSSDVALGLPQDARERPPGWGKGSYQGGT